MKYVRFAGHNKFVIFPDNLVHIDMARNVEFDLGIRPVSAGFVYFDKNGKPVCHDRSESLNMDSRPDDSAAMADFLGL